MTRWGLVSTIKAPPKEVLNFVAYHLDQGAHHLFIYLDNQNPKAQAALEAHPQVTVTRTDGAYWRGTVGRKPEKHQPRQTHNATQAYEMAPEFGLDWLGHIDVDEFLSPVGDPLDQLLGRVENGIAAARVAPAEALASEDVEGLDPATIYAKAWVPDTTAREKMEAALYPDFGNYVRGGFISHTLGKTFLRTGLPPLQFRIHRGMRGNDEVGPRVTLDGIDLCHIHVKSWQDWQRHFDYRHEKGSYRAELKPVRPSEFGGLSLHQLFTTLRETGGDEAIRAFFNEICLARPALISGLRERNLLREFRLDLDARREAHFPDWQKTR
ncbi:glycosyltransferase family 2 protein [Shimia sp. CNT1-13L.2]|uniref:glycosyltransferase family 2 protein n=1 Tax=Shimia sp. CNT1-13L.2 TaxID=2959663 RepID=UPI0020CEE7CE|nr:glycosyltransferase family 2 protein [Shimia sp. CNT1-13L.2]